MLSGNVLVVDKSGSVFQEDVGTPAIGGPDNLLHVGLGAPRRVEPGRTMGISGFAYVDADDLRVFFMDPFSEILLNMSIAPAVTPTYWTLTAEDVDYDGQTEYVGLKRLNFGTLAVYVVDFNDDTLTEHSFPGVGGTLLGLGDFNGDTQFDAAINVDGGNRTITIDLSAGTVIGTFDVDGTIRDHSAIGRFSDPAADQIVLSNESHVWVVNGDGTCNLNMTHAYPVGINLLNYGGGLSDVAIADNLGRLTLYQGTDLAQIFQTFVGPVGGQLFSITGNFTGDAQVDIVTVSRNWNVAQFMDGSNGTIIRETVGISANVQVLQKGMIDNEPMTDVVLMTGANSPCFIHGHDAEIAFTVTLVESTDGIRTFDLDENGRDDIFISSGNDLYILMTELEPPEIVQAPLSPLHPTVEDDYVTFEVRVNEATAVHSAELFLREVGTSTWTQPHGEMLASGDGKTFFAFLVGLDAAMYDYYIRVEDVYLNAGYIANETHPNTFEITGHLAWQHDRSETYDRFLSHQVVARGNLSDSSPVIYTLELDLSGKTVYLNKYLADGALVDAYAIDFTSGYDFALVSGMLDGDSILDPVAIVSAGGNTMVYALHGSDHSLYHSTIAPIFLKSIRLFEILDGNGDGRDDLYLLIDTEHYSLARMDSGGTWTWRDLADPENNDLAPKFMVGAHSGTGMVNNLTIVRGNTLIETFDGSNISFYRSIWIPSGGFSDVVAKTITTVTRSVGAGEEFALGLTFWSGAVSETRIYIYNGTADDFPDLDAYFLADKDVSFLFPFDVEQDGVYELLVLDESGQLVLARVIGPLSTDWAIQVSDLTPLSGIVTDFDGDLVDEFVLFTKEDGGLTAVTPEGEIVRTVVVGEVHVPISLGNIDPGAGQDIAAYPIVRNIGDVVVGAIRDLDWFYRMTVAVEHSLVDVIQGEPFWSNVTVTNIYGETVEDASVYMSVHFMTPEGPASNTFGFYFDPPSAHYSAVTDTSWPMGMLNLSVSVDHDFYQPAWLSIPDALAVRSDLRVSVWAPETVAQGENMTVEVWVLDNHDVAVEGATVMVSIGGSDYAAMPQNQSYVFEMTEVQLSAGLHDVIGTATHPYAVGPGEGSYEIRVNLLAENLIVSSDFPGIVQQDDPVASWFNITDSFGQPIEFAYVSLKSGPEEFHLTESTTSPGSYRFSHNMTLGIGNRTFDLRVIKEGITGSISTQIAVQVFGELEPNVFYIPRVEAGSSFEVSVFVKDKYGPVFVGTSVIVEINGTRYTATHTDGEPEYVLMVLADFYIGPDNFTVYANATYSSPWSDIFYIRSFADAASSAEITSSQGWTIEQGGRTVIQLVLRDWVNRPVAGGTVNFFVKALSYSMLESAQGTYAATLSTSGWSPGEYNYTISVNHPDIETGDPVHGVLTVTGQLIFDITVIQESPTQGQPLDIVIAIQDIYGNPVPGLDVSVSLMNMPIIVAQATDVVGEYHAFFAHLPTTEGYGDFTAIFTASGEHVATKVEEETITVSPAVPDLAMSTESISLGAGMSFILSLIGMFVYFRMAASTRVDDKSLEGLKKSVKRMDRLYLMIVVASGIGLAGSYMYFSIAEYGLALVLTIVLLGSSVLLYGLWLYRDAVSAVLIKGALSRGRMAFGLWHLVFVPLVIVMILSYGTEIDWFKHYVIDQSFTIGDLRVPAIMTTIFAAYVSSIIVVVVNLYREASKGIKKIAKMEESGTPTNIVEDEKTSMIGRFSSSIRIKFLMFLVVVGAATVMSMDFLQSYALGIIVLMPVVFLVIIPYISSQIIKMLGRASGAARGKKPAEATSAAEDGLEPGELT